MPTGIAVVERIPPEVQKPVVINDSSCIRHERIRGEECAQAEVVIAGVVVEQPGCRRHSFDKLRASIDEGSQHRRSLRHFAPPVLVVVDKSIDRVA